MEGQARISTDVLARYAADATAEVPGVLGLVESKRHRHRGVLVRCEGETLAVELHVAVEWGASVPQVGRELQQRVVEYLGRMADARPVEVDVVVEAVGAD
jgi:uncharacterized alkaline shock family protein YloU